MVKMISPSPSPSKLLEAKLLITWADSKAKAKSKSTKKAKKTTKPSIPKAPAKVIENDGSDIEVVDDGLKLETIK